eukprot:2689416-Prymnesium_polylepis.1
MGWLDSVWQNAASPPAEDASAPLLASGACTGYELQRGLDYSGADIYGGDMPAADEAECCAACERNRVCNAFTYVLAQRKCWLKRNRR